MSTIQETMPKTLEKYKYLLILLAASGILLQTGYFVDEDSAWWISSIVYVLVPGALVALASHLTIKMAKSGQSITLILLFTISVTMAFLGEQIWFGYELMGEDPFPSWADVFYLGQYPPLVIFLFKLIKLPVRTIPIRNLVFVVLLSSSFFIPTYWSIYDTDEENLFDLVIALSYNIANVIILIPILLGILYMYGKQKEFLFYILVGTFFALAADTFYTFLDQQDLYFVGSPVDILWIWGYIFYAFAIYPPSRFLNYLKERPAIFQPTNNHMIPLLTGGIFLVSFLTLVTLTFFVNSTIEEAQMESLIFYGIFVLFLLSVGLTLFALKIKRIKEQVLVGLVFICIIFVIQTVYNNSIEDKQIGISEYHDIMSAPASTALNEIEVELEHLHRSVYIFKEDPETGLSNYYDASYEIKYALDKYGMLAFQKNTFGDLVADQQMQQMMNVYTGKMENSIEKLEVTLLDFFSKDAPSNSQTELMLSDINAKSEAIHDILQEAKIMELDGQKASQSKIYQFSEMKKLANLLSVGFLIFSIVAITLIISKTIKNNIKILKETTREISKGNFDARVVLKDETEFSAIGEQINHMAAELGQFQSQSLKIEKLKSIGELASRLGHDLRNPLSTIKTAAAIINMKAEKAGDLKYTKNLASIEIAIDRMSYQIESVLDFIRTKPLALSECSLNNVISETIKTIKVPKNIRINIDPTEVKVFCDSYRISIVFTNLITNAIQAIGGSPGEITISVKKSLGQIICSVIDSGPGIPEDNITKVFEPLFTTKQTGTGLGLPSCKNIIEQHNGTISCHNNPTTFTITMQISPLKYIRNETTR